MTSQSSQVQVGMAVVGSDGDQVGDVKEIGVGDFLVDRGLLSGKVSVPFSAIRDVTGNTVALTIPGKQVGDMGWPTKLMA